MGTYEEAINWIHGREKFKIKPGLKRMEWMMEKLDHPEKSFQKIHIAGTNGKGSTLSFLRYLLQEQGKTVGTFTSPYIVRFNERISIDGTPISDTELAELVEEIKPLTEELGKTMLGEPTEFEVITAMSILYFSRKNPDLVIFETGLGGRLDSTNIIDPILSIITTIGKDHMNILGSSYKEIAMEKAGIIKCEKPVISGVHQPEAKEVIKEKAKAMKAEMFALGDDFHVSHLSSEDDGEWFTFRSDSFTSAPMKSGLMGFHQVQNASLAIQAVEWLRSQGMDINRNRYNDALMKTRWPARFERVHEAPIVILDGAHNEEGTVELAKTLKNHYEDKEITLLYAALEDKPVHRMLETLAPEISQAVFTSFDFPRAMSAEQLLKISPFKKAIIKPDVKKALTEALRTTDRDNVLLITGSLYFISEIRKYFESKVIL